MAVLAAAVGGVPLVVASAGKAGYAGQDSCAACHGDIAAAMAKTPHAQTLDILKNAASDTNAECLACHTTGAEGTAYVDGAVTCEACHGPGADHVAAAADAKKTTIRGAVDATVCAKCHTSDWSPNFNFESYKARGTHVGAP